MSVSASFSSGGQDAQTLFGSLQGHARRLKRGILRTDGVLQPPMERVEAGLARPGHRFEELVSQRVEPGLENLPNLEGPDP